MACELRLSAGRAWARARWCASWPTSITTARYGEGEKGVWDPRVLEDIAAGVNAVGVTEYFARLYDANYRDAAEHDGPGKVIFFEGARITLEAHMAEYPPEEHAALRKVLAIGDAWNPGPRDRADLEHRHHREAHPPCATAITKTSRTWCAASA